MSGEGRDRHRELDAGAQVLSGQLGKTIQRLRKAYNLSLSELAEQSGVAKSIISQIERNETNPTLATIWRLSQALDVSIERVLAAADDEPFLEGSSQADTPILLSQDGKMRLAIIGWLKTVEWLQWYDVRSEPGGVLESEGHQRGSVESLATIVLRDGDTRPAELRDLLPEAAVIGARLGQFPHLRGRKTGGEELVGGALDLLLFVVQVEVHFSCPLISASAGRARARR